MQKTGTPKPPLGSWLFFEQCLIDETSAGELALLI
jgi:hypothetical protein